MSARKTRLLVTIDLDAVPGWGYQSEDYQEYVQSLLDDVIGHYHPKVEILDDSEPSCPAVNAEV